MRAIGLSERVMALALERSMKRKAFGKELARHATVQKVRYRNPPLLCMQSTTG